MSLMNIIRGTYGTGWVRDVPDARDWEIDRMDLSSSSSSTAVTLSDNVPHVLSQKSVSACVGFGIAGGIIVRETVVGLPYSPPSTLYIYYNARKYKSRIVRDTGCSIRYAVKGLVKAGVPDNKYWPFTTNPIIVNRAPGWKAHMEAYARKGGEYFRINSDGSKRVDEIKLALNNGYPVVFGTEISEGFKKRVGTTMEDKPGSKEKIVGGHCMLVVGYEEGAFGIRFEVLNSWGSTWRNNGYIWLTEDYIRWDETSDFTIIRGWDRIKGLEDSVIRSGGR